MVSKALRLITLIGLAASSSAQSDEGDEGDTYFGTPLGALHFSSDETSAEIYAADEFTIIFNHFYHNPKQPGCTAIMLGPARNEDKENVIEGHGLLLAPAHPPVAASARHRIRRQSADDQLTSRLEQFRSWPVEFDHLLMQPPRHNEGIKTAAVSSSTPPRNDNSFGKLTLGVAGLDQPASAIVPKNASKNERSPSVPALTQSSVGSSPTHASTTLTTTATTTTSSTKQHQNEGSGQATIKPLILLGSKNHVSSPRHNNLRRVVKPGAVADVTAVNDANLGVVVTSSGETYAINSQSPSAPAGQPPELVVAQTSKVAPISNSEGVRRAPIRGPEPLTQDNLRNDPKWMSTNSEKGILASEFTATTPLFWVIKDPREPRRQRLLELRRKVAQTDHEDITTTTTTTQAAITRFDERFELPRIRDKLATFSLTNGAKINQYKWIGLYDQCLRRHIPLVTLRDVDPPREEKIMPLSGWSHNVTSYRVHILNCNTILVPGFTYDARNTTANTYFFVGIGEFPKSIERQVKVTVVGSRRNEPLREYNREDILLRLPKGYRTFDIDFISVYNTDEKKSFGHVIIPSLLVPPCSED